MAATQTSVPRPMVKVRPWPSSAGSSVCEDDVGGGVVRVGVHGVRAVESREVGKRISKALTLVIFTLSSLARPLDQPVPFSYDSTTLNSPFAA